MRTATSTCGSAVPSPDEEHVVSSEVPFARVDPGRYRRPPMAQQLVGGDKLPPLNATDLDGNPVDITASVAGHWAAILLYRGDW